jgi:hypothetical protein
MVRLVAVLPVKVMLVGEAGAVAGMAVTVLDQSLVPSAVLWETRNWEGMPRVRPVTVINVEAEMPSLKVVQVVPSVEYWMV